MVFRILKTVVRTAERKKTIVNNAIIGIAIIIIFPSEVVLINMLT